MQSKIRQCRGSSDWLERQTVDLEVMGSIPIPGTKRLPQRSRFFYYVFVKTIFLNTKFLYFCFENVKSTIMASFEVVTHPLIEQKLRYLRDINTPSREFKKLLSEISYLMAFEITRDLPIKPVEIETPLAKTVAYEVAEHIALVPILRAGLGMVDGIHDLIPTARVGHIGLYRDEQTLEPKEYYCKLPNDIDQRLVILLDPMLATGNSTVYAIDLLKKHGVKKIKFVSIVAAPEGVRRLQEKHPDVQAYSAALDDHLNENGYIVPGLGDCGDRLFGTL